MNNEFRMRNVEIQMEYIRMEDDDFQSKMDRLHKRFIIAIVIIVLCMTLLLIGLFIIIKRGYLSSI